MPGLYASAFLMAFSTLVFEIALTRIFSVTMWYHFSFMVISIAMLGFGASGAFLTIFSKILAGEEKKTAMLLSALFSVMCLLGLFVVQHTAVDLFKLAERPQYLAPLALLCVVLLLPFFVSGLFNAFLITKIPQKVGTLYFANLAGAGAGCFMVIFLIPWFSNAGAVLFAATAAMLSALVLSLNGARRLKIALGVSLAVLLFLTVNASSLFEFRIVESKGLSWYLGQGMKPLLTRYNAFSQVSVMEAGSAYYAPGISKTMPHTLPGQKMIFIDSDAVTPITNLSGGRKSLDFLHYVPSSIAYEFKKGAQVCIIGTGGGFDILSALHVGDAARVTAVEINPLITGLVSREFGGYAGNLYANPKVVVEHNDGRNFIRHSREKYDVIQMSLVDTWAAASNNAYSLTENYLYTTEAFEDYVDHLADDGILTVTRWYLSPPKESLRLAAIGYTALENRGAGNPADHIVFIQSERVAVMLLKKTAFTPAEVETLGKLAGERGFNVLYAPGIPADNIFFAYFNSADKYAFYESCPYNVSPSFDDKPYYFQSNTWKQWARVFSDMKALTIDRNFTGQVVLAAVLALVVVFSALFIAGPLFLSGSREQRPGLRRHGRMLAYFALLGMGFMFIEVALIQKCILFLGHPVYSFSVVLFSLLLSAGLGSMAAGRTERPRLAARLRNVLFGIALFSLAYLVLLPGLPALFPGGSLPARMFITVLLIVPLGFLMGMPLPLMVRSVDAGETHLIPWYWGINGCFSVVSSVLSIIIAMNAGYYYVIIGGALSYFLAAVIVHQRVAAREGETETGALAQAETENPAART
ncbi:MAG: spermine/spermidine synthase domain-containing protein [Endomicrobiales bacterium]